jgi:hypothetical protein
MNRDVRYEHVKCTKCGNAYQLIDFNGNPHAWFCKPEADPDDIARLKREYPEIIFGQF